MVKSTGDGVKSLDQMEPQERAFQERLKHFDLNLTLLTLPEIKDFHALGDS